MDRTEANTGTREVSERLRFDVAALERWMADHVPGAAGPLAVSQFKGGQSNPTYRIDTPSGRSFVLRRKPPGKLLPGAHAVDPGRIHCPVLLVAGEEDQVAPPSVAQMMRERLRSGGVTVLSKCGHWMTIERPEECNQALRDFLQRNRP